MLHDTNQLRHAAVPALEDLDALTVLCKATGDAQRLRILRILRNDSLGVLEMSRILNIRQSALSHHLKLLLKAELVSTRRESNTIFYRRVFLSGGDPLGEFKAAVFATLDRTLLDTELAERLAEVKREREQISLDFFRRCAARFRQKQDLVVDSRQYASNLLELIEELKLDAQDCVLEVGPGEGELLTRLAERCGRVIALDNAEEMLEKAKQRVARDGIDNIEFVHGDTRAAVRQGLQARLVVVCMVLHHASSPAELLMDCHQLLEDGGALLLADLCPHQQDWVRETCGDLWQGFEPEDLSNWASQAGFESGQSLYLGLRNGFQVQLRLFHKRSGLAPGPTRSGPTVPCFAR